MRIIGLLGLIFGQEVMRCLRGGPRGPRWCRASSAAVDEDGRERRDERFIEVSGLVSPIFAQKRRTDSALLPGKFERTGRKGRALGRARNSHRS